MNQGPFLCAERKAGEMLEEMVKHEGGRPPENCHTMVQFCLPEGITRNQSSRWQPFLDCIPHGLTAATLSLCRICYANLFHILSFSLNFQTL